MLERLCGPNVITIEGDVLPAERSDMGKQIAADNLTLGAQFGNSAPEINGVPEDDSRDGEIEARVRRFHPAPGRLPIRRRTP